MDNHISRYFTMPGRVLILLTIVLAIAGTWVYIYWIVDSLPAGRYPVFMFAVPVYLAAGLFFLLGRFVLKCFGYTVLIEEGLRVEDDSEDAGD